MRRKWRLFLYATISLTVVALSARLLSGSSNMSNEPPQTAETQPSWNIKNQLKQTDENWINSGALVSSQLRTVKLTVVGDLMVHGMQAEDALRKGGGVYDYNYGFSYVKKLFQGSDIVAGNLETVLGGPDIGYRDYPNFSVTDEYAEAVKNAGFTVLTTANNHSLDQGESKMLRTLSVLDQLGISHMGTYKSAEDRDKILMIEKNGISFAFLSYTYGTNGISLPQGSGSFINYLNEGLFTADINRAKALNPDFVVVMPHMGNEYETFTRPEFDNVIMAMLRAGADIVMASHPHVVQPAKYVSITDSDGTERLCFVAYSMGNFISGQRTKPREAGVIFNLYFEKAAGEKAVLKDVSMIPTWVKAYDRGSTRDVAVLSVYDTLTAHYWGQETGLSATDFKRVEDVQLETTAIILGASVPLESIQPEYFFTRP